MKNRTESEKIYKKAMSSIINYFVTPSQLVYFLSTIADLVYDVNMKSGVTLKKNDTHKTTHILLRNLAEPWISKDFRGMQINLKCIHQLLGCDGFYKWVTDVLTIYARLKNSRGADDLRMYSVINYFVALYKVAGLFEQMDSLRVLEGNGEAV